MLQSPFRQELLAKLAHRGCGGRASSLLWPTAAHRQHEAAASRLSCRFAVPPSVRARASHHLQSRGFTSTSTRSSYSPPTKGQAYPQPSFLGRAASSVYKGLKLVLGSAFLGFVILSLALPKPPPRGSPDDLRLRAELHARAAELPLVRDLLASPDWSAHHHDAYAALPDASKPNRLTTGPLGSAQRIGGYQHVFHNAVTGEVLTVVYLGSATYGFPMVAHGGLLATLLDEQCARAAMEDQHLAGGGDNEKKGIVTARLELNYRRPALACEFHVMKARAVPEEELSPSERGKRNRKVWVQTSLEDMDGRVCVEGRALYVKPAGTNLKPVAADF